MQNLDIPEFPLTGTSLIEASAGTGKTFTIVNLYLRLVLGHKCTARTVDNILVVTFTNAATEELKERIRSRLHEAWLSFYSGHSEDPLLARLIGEMEDPDLCCKRLILAMHQMDEATVFTIHGFCNRVLTEFAFESGSQYDQQLVTDESEWLQMAVNDFWRSRVATLEPDSLALLLSCYSGPLALMEQIKGLLTGNVSMTHVRTIAQAQDASARYLSRLTEIKSWWQKSDLFTALKQAKFKGNVKLGKPDTLIAMDTCMLGEGVHPPFLKEGWSLFGEGKIKAACSKSSPDLSALGMEKFDQLSELYNTAVESLTLAFLSEAVSHVKTGLAFHKQRLGLQSPDDLLTALNDGLINDQSGRLAEVVRSHFPVAMIDEFQDTDPVQFDIFRRLYADSGLLWVMIGDPKQAIYGFRGADIFTYIEAKRLVDEQQQFTLGVNWRSNAALVECVNQLFSFRSDSFLAGDAIPFMPVTAANQGAQVKIGGTVLPSIMMYVPQGDDDPMPSAIAEGYLGAKVASQISALLENGTIGEKRVEAADCCVLVRDRTEAARIRQVLNDFGIPSVFLARNSVFETTTARSLFLLLQAISMPGSEPKIRAALASELFAFDGATLEAMFTDDAQWQQIVDDFYQFQNHWHQRGVMSMLNQLMVRFGLAEKLVACYADGARILTDLRHLAELLQQQSVLMPADSQLLSWFYHQLYEPDANNDGQQVRLESDANLVQIITMHASKGLEFPLVFVPYACRFREASKAVYHSDTQGRVLDPLRSDGTMQIADRERLAEDIRLFYVAVTRAQYFCGIGIWNIAHPRRKKDTMFRATSPGYLLSGEDEKPDRSQLMLALQSLCEAADLGVESLADVPQPSKLYPDTQATGQKTALEAASVRRQVQRNWQLTSYSAISKHQLAEELNRPGYDESEGRADVGEEQDGEPSRFSFTRGAQAGSFLHGVLENIRFSNSESLQDVIHQQAQWFGIEEQWTPVVRDWLKDVLVTPIRLGAEEVCLAQLKDDAYLAEMEFYLPLKRVSAQRFNSLINQYSEQVQRHYQFDQLNGMLKGFIDLTFSHNGRYYVADYKSNHLGNDIEDYQQDRIEQAMVEHDYHLQGILYVLALHRWLKQHIPDYQYHTHVGGACYLFMRGMSARQPGYGIYSWCPPESLIMSLDDLFNGLQRNDPSGAEEQLSLW